MSSTSEHKTTEASPAARKDLEFEVLREVWGKYVLPDMEIRARPVLFSYWETGAEKGQLETQIEMTVRAPDNVKGALKHPLKVPNLVRAYKPTDWRAEPAGESTYRIANGTILTLTLFPAAIRRYDLSTPTGEPLVQADWQARANTTKIHSA